VREFGMNLTTAQEKPSDGVEASCAGRDLIEASVGTVIGYSLRGLFHNRTVPIEVGALRRTSVRDEAST